MRLPLFALTFLFAACADPDDSAGQANSGGATAVSPDRAPLILDHDFGLIPHGQQRTHEFDLDLAQLVDPFVPLRVHLECSCGRASLRLRKQDGSERFVDGTGYAHNMPAADERAVLHIELDTQKKEAVDLPSTVSHGYILLQPLDDPTGLARIRWKFVVRFSIDAPVELRPFAALDFGRVAASTSGTALTTLRGDENHKDLTFGEVRTSDENLEAWLEAADGHTVLRARVHPGQRGNHRALIQIATSLDSYSVALEAAWKVVPDLEATPISKVSFSTPLDRAQPEGSEVRQFVLCTDHNRTRTPEFVLSKIVDERGKDVSDSFEVEASPVSSSARQQRVTVRYLGGLQNKNGNPRGPNDTFRGKMILTKHDPDELAPAPLLLPIDLVVFPSRQP